MTEHDSGSNRPRQFGWAAAFLGGMVAIGGTAFLGTLLTNILVRIEISNGLTQEKAYAALASSGATAIALMSLFTIALPCAAGGYISAKYGRGRPIFQSAIAGVIAILFVVAMYLNPSSFLGPNWFIALSLTVPLVFSLLGGYIYVRRTTAH